MEETRFSFTVEAPDANKRLDKYLTEKLPKELSRTLIQKLISSSNVLLNGKAALRSHKVLTGDRLEINVPPASNSYIEAEDIPSI